MKVAFTKDFHKQLAEINDKKLSKAILAIIENVEQANSLKDIISVKKLKGHKAAYRIRSGDYRIGFFIEKGEALFAAVVPRQSIYKQFP
jgi:mRNA interferase RelE/StbE